MIPTRPVSIFHHRPAACLRVCGPDAAEFLQGQFTNDVAAIPPGGSAYGLWLDAKGRVSADSFLVRTGIPDEFRLLSYGSAGAALRARLEAFIVADDVAVEDDSPAWAAVSLLPVQGAEDRGLAAWALGGECAGAGHLFEGRRGIPGALEWLYPVERSAEVGARLAGLPVREAEDMERIRIGAGIPRVPLDIGPGDLPAEGGLDAFVSATKGCFIGQEVVARLRSRGRLRRNLVRVRSTGPLPPLPASLVRQDGIRAGEIRSAVAAVPAAGSEQQPAGFIGLALILVDALAAGHPLFLEKADASAPDSAPVLAENLAAS